MVSTFTANINLEEPARGDQVGVWDTPVNNNMTLADLVVGGSVTISGAAGSVVLAAAQFQAANVTFNSTLLASITVTFPSTFKKGYTVRNTCTGSSAFIITLQTTVAGGQVIACRPGNPFQCWNDGTNLYFVNLGTEVGGYWDYAGSSVPSWVSGCTVPPYLNCDGTTFSATTYPQLAIILGSTTLPDSKGRSRFALDQAAGRISSAATVGFSGSTVGSAGGGQATTLLAVNLPAYTPAGTISITQDANQLNAASGTPGPFTALLSNRTAATITASFTGTAQGGTSTPLTNLPPAYIGGLTLLRSA